MSRQHWLAVLIIFSFCSWGIRSATAELTESGTDGALTPEFFEEQINNESLSPHTGSFFSEQDKNPEMYLDLMSSQPRTLDYLFQSLAVEKPAALEASGAYFVYTNRLRIRATTAADGEILGVLDLNDQVQLKDGTIQGEFVELKSFTTQASIKSSEHYYVAYYYLSRQKNESRQESNSYFMVQNVATEKLRVYERGCMQGSCRHHLVLETDIAVGEPEDERMTAVGHFNVNRWVKFYEDGKGLYPSWYDPSYPPPPGPSKGAYSWTRGKYMPEKGGATRGAFGWYTALVGPNSFYQWTHGTIGWGQNKKEFVEKTRKFFANLMTDPRSHGCTRTDNESIAYIRQVLPVGATVLKVYAKEAYGDSSRSRYSQTQGQWNYIMTKNGVRADGQRADRGEVLGSGTPQAQWLEEGSYDVDRYPDAKAFSPGGSGARKSKNGNVYALEDNELAGVFLVDEGRFVGYQHPARLKRGGHSDVIIPSFVTAAEGTSYQLPEKD